ncbi:MAG: hypothetical protein OQL20_06230 [Sedimenticola sp.]|nr:hypothetical protein [Sedimenticola sp.]
MKFLYLLACLIFSGEVQSNPIIIHHSHDFIWWWGVGRDGMPIWYGFITALIGLSLEFIFIWLYLRHRIQRLGGMFIGINSITFPITQLIAYPVGVLSELMPIIGEKLFYNRNNDFKRMGYRGWALIIAGNALSWLVGYLSTHIYFKYLYET